MGDDRKSAVQPHRSRSWRRRLLIGLATLFLLLVVFHGPILRSVVHAVAVKLAARQNLKLAFRVEGGVLGGITLRDVHATATGPSAVQSLEADLIRADYSLTNLVLHGMSDFLRDVEVRNFTAVLDPSKAPSAVATPTKPNEKMSLPAYFPDRLQVSNLNITIRGQPQDTVVRNFNLGLYPDREGSLRIDKLQIPNVHAWTDITATTTYTKKNLFLRNLTLDEGHHFQTVNIDTAKAGGGTLTLQIAGAVGEGKIEGSVAFTRTKSSFDTTTKMSASGISLGALGEYFGRPAGALTGDVKNFQMDWRGALDAPQTWSGTIVAQVDNVRQSGFAFDHVGLDIVAKNGSATVREARVDTGTNHLQVRGTVQLPKTTEGFRRTPGDLQLKVDAPDLRQLTAFLPEPVTGSLQANGTIKTDQSIARLELTAQGGLIGFGKAVAKTLTATISAVKKLPATDAAAEPFYANLTSSIHAELGDVRYDQFVFDTVRAEIKSKEAMVSLEPVSVQRNANQFLVRGNYQLPPPGSTEFRPTEQPVDLQFSLRAPQLADYWQSEAPSRLTGQMQADGVVRIRKGLASGQVNLSGEQITAQKLLVKQLSAQVAIAENIAYLNDFTATFNEKGYVVAQGTVKLEKPFHYTGSATANLGNLSSFEPLLNGGGAGSTPPATTEGRKTPLAGSLVVNWNGQGDVATLQKNGDLKLKLEHARYADLQNLHADVEAHYTAREFNVPILFVGSDKLSFEAILQAKDATLEISKIEINQGQAQYATAYAAIPFVWNNLGTGRPLVPPNGKVLISFQSQNLDIARVFESIGAKPPAVGQLSIKLDAKGPVEQLEARLDLQMQNLRAAALANLEPATFNLTAQLQNNELRVDGKIQQAKIQPVQLEGRLPLDIAKMLAARKFDEQTPVNATVRMPPSPINFVKQFIPELRDLDGSVALNVRIGGTIAQPAVSGSADASINLARLENPTIPALTNFRAQLNFRDNALSFDRFGGELAGGPFTVTGRIALPKLTEPTFDLRLKGTSLLVARNDTVTARVDADLKVEGPLKAATVSGQVLTTNSRFLKNIDIIPIGLPGRPARRPPESVPVLSFPKPLGDWKFDLTIKSKDPFLIRGNLATGEAIVDLKLEGTGLHPGLQGQVRLSNFEATLPFSRLTIQYGFLLFDPDDPLNPRIELHGTSLLRDYTIHVFVYGTALAPEAVFNSEPPLPQEEIIALLATGVTRAELSGGGNILASRAALLLVKQLYRKVFKKGDETASTESIFDRFDVEFGNIDPRTGQQTTTARFQMTDKVLLLGEIGVQGDFRGLVKYLIRFR